MSRERSIQVFKSVTWFGSCVAISRLINHVTSLIIGESALFALKKQINIVAYRLELPASMKIHPVFHASLLEIYHESTISRRSQPTPPSVEIDGCEEYEVESILDSQIWREKLEYFVHWRGYPINERTWEPASNLSNAPKKIQIFHHQHSMQPCTNHRFHTQKIKLLEGSRS